MKRTTLPLLATPSCDGCGACCMIMSIPPYLGDEDDAWWISLPVRLKHDIGTTDKNYTGPCIWLDLTTKKCRNYEHRPPTCREFEPGCDVCLEDRARECAEA